MKKIKLFLFTSVIVLLLTACGGEGNTNEEKDESENITLRVTSALPPSQGAWAEFYMPWMEQVEEETDGRVTFETFTSGELVESTNEMEALKQGTVDIAAPLLTIYDPATFPFSEVSMLPLTETSPAIGSSAYQALLNSDVELKDGKTFSELEFGDNGLKALPTTISEEYSISTTGLKFDSVENIKKAKLRTPSRIHELFTKNIGANSITMPIFDLYDALNRGALDGSFLFISDWSGYGFDELFTYTISDANLGHFGQQLGMTEERWEELPEDIQEIMIKASEDHVVSGAENWAAYGDENIEKTKEAGAEFVTIDELDSEVQELLITGMEDTWFDFIELLENEGEPGTELAILWRDIVIEQGGDVPEAIKEIE